MRPAALHLQDAHEAARDRVDLIVVRARKAGPPPVARIDVPQDLGLEDRARPASIITVSTFASLKFL